MFDNSSASSRNVLDYEEEISHSLPENATEPAAQEGLWCCGVEYLDISRLDLISSVQFCISSKRTQSLMRFTH